MITNENVIEAQNKLGHLIEILKTNDPHNKILKDILKFWAVVLVNWWAEGNSDSEENELVMNQILDWIWLIMNELSKKDIHY